MKQVIFGLIGGLGLFIFGMKFLSDGLQKVAGTKLRRTLRSLTQNRLRGVALGAFVTSLIQSSSVTTVMLVGLVNAGIVSLTQAASVVIGANIGTTITAMLASLVTANPNAVIVAFAHTIFNISGIILLWPIKIVPITMAKKLAEFALISKIIPVAYIIVFFFIFPIMMIFIFR